MRVEPGDSAADTAERPAVLSGTEQRRVPVELVCAHAAEVLEYGSADDLPMDATFHDLGFESLTAVALRDRLAAATGLDLPATLVSTIPPRQSWPSTCRPSSRVGSGRPPASRPGRRAQRRATSRSRSWR